MPISKRDKKVSLTKTTKKGKEWKQNIIEDIRRNLEEFDNLYVFTVHNMRNASLKEVRESWKGSRVYCAKTKLMAIALGRDSASEVQINVHKVTKHLQGQCGLLFTNKPKDYVLEWFQNFSELDFAQSGFVATRTIKLPAGPLTNFSQPIEPHLRSLGLPTCLEKGIIKLREEHIVCTKGAELKPEQASILKLLGEKLAEGKLSVVCTWSKDGSFEKFKTKKHLLKMDQSVNEVKIDKKNKEKNKLSKKNKINQEDIEIPEEVTNSSDNTKEHSHIPDLISQTPMDQDNTSESDVEIPEKVTKTPQKSLTSKKINRTSKLISQTPIDEHSDQDMEDRTSELSNTDTNNLRRSTRLSKLIKRSPDQSKRSVKKLTVSASKVQRNTVKGTPKATKSASTKLQENTPKSTHKK